VNIIFDELKIENFQSIGNIELSISKRGIVLVQGRNEYEQNASSNGSGKTSMFSALFWALYGKTSEGILNPAHRDLKGACRVSLSFSVDSNNYIVNRSILNGNQSVSVTVNGTEHSNRNRTDSDKLIKDNILQMSPDIFLSLVYLSQGFATRLSALTPTARKDRLEQLTNTAELIDVFSEQVSAKKADYNSAMMNIRAEQNQKLGAIDTHEEMIMHRQSQIKAASEGIDYYEKDGVRYTAVDKEGLNIQLTALHAKELEASDIREKAVNDRSTLSQKYQDAQAKQKSWETKISSVKVLLESVVQESKCPTCNQSLPTIERDRLIQQYTSELAEAESEERVYADYVEEISPKLSKASEVLDKAVANLTAIQSERRELSDIISRIPKGNDTNTSNLMSEIESHRDSIKALNMELDEIGGRLIESENKLGVANHCQQLITKQFRAYLLVDSITFLNAQLKYYSSMLFSNEEDCITIPLDPENPLQKLDKLDIYLGNALYDTLSGGERRRTDLAVMLAQRDIASEIAGMSCNMLVLDEVLESMDQTATQVTLDLLEKTSQSVQTMFLISHNNYSLPVDSKITVVKGKDKISYLEAM